MAWKVSDVVSERMKFVVRLENGERMVDLCEELGISTKTGHKYKKRYEEFGPAGLFDQSRRPKRSPQRTAAEIAELVVAARRKHPTWGPKKLRVMLMDENRGVRIPAASTIGVILEDAGLVDGRRRRRRATPSAKLLRESTRSNELWSIDFKGQFKLGNSQLCYPLTVCDHYSRFLIALEGLESTKGGPARSVLSFVFREFGLPDFMRSDNGAPFASTGLGGFSQLSVWLMRLGIGLERIEPGHPEQNGRHERLHRDVKAETTRPPKANLLQQQERFDAFRATFNEERPHEALDMKRPAQLYVPSARKFIEPDEDLSYPLHDHTVRVFTRGEIFLPLKGRPRIHVGEAFVDQQLGLRHIADRTWLLSFVDVDLGYVDEEVRRVVAMPEALERAAKAKGALGEEPSPQIPPPDLKNTPGEEDAFRV